MKLFYIIMARAMLTDAPNGEGIKCEAANNFMGPPRRWYERMYLPMSQRLMVL